MSRATPDEFRANGLPSIEEVLVDPAASLWLKSALRSALSRNLSRRGCPAIFGYDPLLQFVEQDDVVRALVHARRSALVGTFNVGAPGRLPLSEIAAICGTTLFPLPPFKPAAFAAPFVAIGLFDLPPELVALLRYGRGLDTSRFAASGFHYRFTSAEATQAFARVMRLRRGVGHGGPDYRYHDDVERFVRRAHSLWPRGDDD